MQSKLLSLLGGAALSLGLVNVAAAADMAARPYTKAPPIAYATYNWSGFYVGGNAGGGWSRNCWDVVPLVGPLAAEGCHSASGAVVGGQVGYRWQASSWVFGLEAQGNWADLNGSRVSQQFIVAPGDATTNSHVRSFGLFTGQVGYAWNNVLGYVKGGAAVTENRYEHRFTGTNVIFDSARDTRWGGTIGAGLEYGFTPNWSVGVEYNHMFMADRNLTFRNAAGVASTVDRVRQDVDVVTARVNYKFGGPVVARY